MKKLIVTLALLSLAPAVFGGDTLRISAAKLYKAYDRDSAAADKKYKGKEVIVSGTVDKIDKDVLGNSYVRLRAKDSFGVQCNFAPADVEQIAHTRLKKHAVITGKVQGWLGNVVLTDCAFVK